MANEPEGQNMQQTLIWLGGMFVVLAAFVYFVV